MGIGKKKTMIHVGYKELERLIADTYGHKFSVVSDQEWSNHEAHTLKFIRETLHANDHVKVQEFRASGRGNFILFPLMQDMVNSGVLDEGEYVIEISW
jgi:hypothetical protein